MGSQLFRSWLNRLARSPLTKQHTPLINRRRPGGRGDFRSRLKVERFEERDVPSASIPLNSQTWTAIGPSPINPGQSPGGPSSTGRMMGIAVDPTDTKVMYAASDTGGLWRTTDGGKTWSPRTDQQQLNFQTIATVHRAAGNTVYAIDTAGNLWLSTDGATTFTESAKPPFEKGATVNKITVYVTDPNDQTKDILYAAVGSMVQVPPSFFPPVPPELGSGIWRSVDGGATWTNLVDSTKAPFTSNPLNPIPKDSLAFTDVVTSPVDPNVVYAAVGNANGDPTNGIYETTNALSAKPTWTLVFGGSGSVQLPGETPGVIKLGIAPAAPSVIFASISYRVLPNSQIVPLLGVYRSLDGGTNWAPVLQTNPADPFNDPNNVLGQYGYDNDVLLIAPNSPLNPLQQTVYIAGYGLNNTNTVLMTTNSGGTWTQIGVGADGVGTYTNVHQGSFDSQNRLVLATGGGIYRLDTTNPVKWESLNGTPGPNGLDVADFNGFAVNPTNANQAIGNITWTGDGGVNFGPGLHSAVRFNDTGSGIQSPYGWASVDANGMTSNLGEGQVVYNPVNPNIVYRVVPGDVRVSTDGGVTWSSGSNGLTESPTYNVPLVLDASQPNRLFSGIVNIQATDDNAATWSNNVNIGNGVLNQIPALPTTLAGLPITAIGVGRMSSIDFGGTGINGITLFAATPDDVVRTPPAPVPPGAGPYTDDDDPTSTPAGLGPQLWINLIPTNSDFGNFQDAHSWANVTPKDSKGKSLLTGNIIQIIVDPSSNGTIYVFTDSGQVLRGTSIGFAFVQDPHSGLLIGYAPDGVELYSGGQPAGPSKPINSAIATWADITGNLPGGALPAATPVPMALDSQVVSDPKDDVLYAATPAKGVWQLTNPSADFTQTQPKWKEIGLDAMGNPTMPMAPVTAISLSTTTGILGAATYGRGTYEIQVRGLISGHVFTDTNGNGVRDNGETAMSGVTVEVLDQANNNAVVAATVTDSQGYYEFRSLKAGNYTVVAMAGTGLVQTTGTPASLATFTEQSQATVDIGEFKAGSISGTVFEDRNNNAKLDAGEPGLGGFTVFVDSNGNGQFDTGEPSTTSAANGTYTLSNLGPAVVLGAPNPQTFNGTYPVLEVPQAGWNQTTPAPAAVSLKSGQAVAGQLFGNVRTASISGTVYIDANGDGIVEANETGSAGFTVQLVGPGGTRTTTTAADGSYGFFSLQPGDYTVTITVPSGVTQTTANPPTVTLATVDNRTGINFAVFKNVSVSGVVYADTNNNGVRDAGEAGLNGFAVDLINTLTHQVVQTAQTFAGGAFSFVNVGPLAGGAAYAVAEEPKAGFVQTSAPAPFAPVSGTDVTNLAIGNFKAFSVSGNAYVDLNADGVEEAGETGTAGFVIQLFDSSNTLVGTATSLPDGSYTITNVGPGTYTLKESPPAGYTITQGSAGYTISSPTGADVTGQNFGNAPLPSISGIVFNDVNANGTQDATDAGESGFTIQLTGPGGTVQTTTSAADGTFSFVGLTAGDYTITQLPRAGYTRTTSDPATITLTAGGSAGVANFGDFTNVTLGGTAFNDANGNGTKDTGEGGLGNVTFDLVNASTGAVIATTTSAADGSFSFTNVGPAPTGASFAIRERRPMRYVQTTAAPASFTTSSGTNVNTFTFGNTFVPPNIVTATDAGVASSLTVRDAATQTIKFTISPYGAFNGGVRVATGLIGGTVPSVVTVPGPGGGPLVKVFDGNTGALKASFFAYDVSVTNGLFVAVGDVNGDGVDDIVTGVDSGSGPHVKVFDGAALSRGQVQLDASFFAYNPAFNGGVRVAVGDVGGKGYGDVITGAGPGGGPHVQIFDLKAGTRLASYYAYNPGFTTGIYVAAGDVNADGRADVITGPGIGGGPHLRVFNGANLTQMLADTFAYPTTPGTTGWASGLRVGVTDENLDGHADVIVGPGAGQAANIRVLSGTNFLDLLPGGQLNVFDPTFLGGIFVAGE